MLIPEGAFVTDAGGWLLAQAAAAARAALPDTIVTVQAPIEPGWFERTTQILDALLTLSFIVFAAAVIPAAWNFRKSYKKISDLLDRVYADVNPIAHHASRIAENVDYVSTAVRADVQRASATLADAERRLQHAIGRAEGRARELEALLAVAQDEAEETFVDAVSAVRGVRASVSALREELGGARSVAERGVLRGDDRALSLELGGVGAADAHAAEGMGPADTRDVGREAPYGFDADVFDDELEDALDEAFADAAETGDAPRGAAGGGMGRVRRAVEDPPTNADELRPRVRPRRPRDGW